MNRWNYFRRIAKVYLTKDKGYLSFWHERPAVGDFNPQELRGYYMTFADKAAYKGPKDEHGVILFDYFFDIGRQYNPLAIAQYGLGHWNLYLKTKDQKHLTEAKQQAEWLVANLEPNEKGLKVWKHKFPWHYKFSLAPGWYSGHAQGTGISLLARLYKETNDARYLDAARDAFPALSVDIENGGVLYRDAEGGVWLEEYLVPEPTRILNGYLWALWGVWDYWLLTKDDKARSLWNDCVATIEKNVYRYDLGFWSRYDLSRQLLPMIASPYYHSLHVVQLRATSRIAGSEHLESRAKRWEKYARNPVYRVLALILKAIFKVFYF
ncbi:MAG: D-glucuronyl C5-epimerase family protein [Candidatus Jorgensenbacteria bacterium]|nr:D-glucuronyl C5-epimerase family protein [Candidatus Jorgensenbacteria bacterium]